jgi:hypothetical protein
MLSPIIMVLKYSYSPVILCALLRLNFTLFCAADILKEPISARFNLMLAQIGKSLYLYGLLMSVESSVLSLELERSFWLLLRKACAIFRRGSAKFS